MKPATFGLVLKNIQDNSEAVKVGVLYHGGEPLLNRDFTAMVRQLKEIGVPFIKTVSNGMLLTDAAIKGIVESKLDAIEISLDGQSAVESDFVRRNCDSLEVLSNIKKLIDYKRQHDSQLPKITITSTQFLPPPPEMYEQAKELPEPPNWISRALADNGYAGEVDYKCGWAMEWPHMEVMDDTYEVHQVPDGQYSNRCDLVENTITVRWNGDVVACCFDLTSRFVLGNIHEADLITIWNDHKFRGLRRSIDKKKFIPMCANCNIVRPNVYLSIRPEVLVTLQRSK
jgi:radical SAM protein with 4Fe4S-binding SPASM domain